MFELKPSCVLLMPGEHVGAGNNWKPVPGHPLTVGRIKGEYDTLTGRGAPDLHGQLYRSVRRSAFGGGDRRIHLRGRSSHDSETVVHHAVMP